MCAHMCTHYNYQVYMQVGNVVKSPGQIDTPTQDEPHFLVSWVLQTHR